jgi:flagellar motor component MotA
MIQYFIAMLVFFTGFVFTVFFSGGSINTYLDFPTFIIVGLLPFLFTSVLFGFREMKAAYQTVFQKENDTESISKSKGFFNILGITILIMGMTSMLAVIIGMLTNLESKSEIGPKTALAMLSIHYSAILYLVAVLPFTLLLKKKQKSQSAEDDDRRLA